MTSVVRFVKPQAMRLVVADDDARHAREAEARDVERALAVTMRHFRPTWCHTLGSDGAEVRVVGEQRHPALGEVARDDPRVRADAFADVADERADRLDDAVDLVPLDRRGGDRPRVGGRTRSLAARPAGMRGDRRARSPDCGRTDTPGTARRSGRSVKSGAIIARSVSSSMLVRRSQAIAFSHATESSGVHGSIS